MNTFSTIYIANAFDAESRKGKLEGGEHLK